MPKTALFCVVFGFFHLQGRGNPPDPKYYNKYCSPRGQELCTKVSEKPWIWTVAPSHIVPLKKVFIEMHAAKYYLMKNYSFSSCIRKSIFFVRLIEDLIFEYKKDFTRPLKFSRVSIKCHQLHLSICSLQSKY